MPPVKINIYLLSILLFFSFTTPSYSVENEVLKLNAQYFTQIGHPAQFQWAPQNYKYDIIYYIPQSLRGKKNVKALIFNHGGGRSTLTRAGSLDSVISYENDLIKLANELDFVAILPSSSGLNWNGHTEGMMRELVKLLRKEINVDPNRIGLAGHSMGGMGISRSYGWLADQFAFFLTTSSGMNLSVLSDLEKEQALNKEFNVPYLHFQGWDDPVEGGLFVDLCHEQIKETQILEKKYQVKSKLKIDFYNAGHNYQYPVFKQHLRDAFQFSRNLYQPELWGSLRTSNSWITENGVAFQQIPVLRYFWVEASSVIPSLDEKIDFHAQIKDQEIHIEINSREQSKELAVLELRIYLSSKLIDLHQQIKVFINGQLNTIKEPSQAVLTSKNIDASDQGFQFEDQIDIRI